MREKARARGGGGTPSAMRLRSRRAFEGRPLIIQACGDAGAVQARRAPRRSPASWTCIRFTSSPGPLRNLPMLIRAPGCSICRRTTLDPFLGLPVSPLPVPSDDMTPPCEHFDGCDSVIISFWSSQASIFAGIGPVCAAHHARDGWWPVRDSDPIELSQRGQCLAAKIQQRPLGAPKVTWPKEDKEAAQRTCWLGISKIELSVFVPGPWVVDGASPERRFSHLSCLLALYISVLKSVSVLTLRFERGEKSRSGSLENRGKREIPTPPQIPETRLS